MAFKKADRPSIRVNGVLGSVVEVRFSMIMRVDDNAITWPPIVIKSMLRLLAGHLL